MSHFYFQYLDPIWLDQSLSVCVEFSWNFCGNINRFFFFLNLKSPHTNHLTSRRNRKNTLEMDISQTDHHKLHIISAADGPKSRISIVNCLPIQTKMALNVLLLLLLVVLLPQLLLYWCMCTRMATINTCCGSLISMSSFILNYT